LCVRAGGADPAALISRIAVQFFAGGVPFPGSRRVCYSVVIRKAWTGTLLGRDLGEQRSSVSKHGVGKSARVTVQTLRAMTSRSERIVMVTAYDATFARMLDEGGTDILL